MAAARPRPGRPSRNCCAARPRRRVPCGTSAHPAARGQDRPVPRLPVVDRVPRRHGNANLPRLHEVVELVVPPRSRLLRRQRPPLSSTAGTPRQERAPSTIDRGPGRHDPGGGSPPVVRREHGSHATTRSGRTSRATRCASSCRNACKRPATPWARRHLSDGTSDHAGARDGARSPKTVTPMTYSCRWTDRAAGRPGGGRRGLDRKARRELRALDPDRGQERRGRSAGRAGWRRTGRRDSGRRSEGSDRWGAATWPRCIMAAESLPQGWGVSLTGLARAMSPSRR
jgi:hypothetical protein